MSPKVYVCPSSYALYIDTILLSLIYRILHSIFSVYWSEQCISVNSFELATLKITQSVVRHIGVSQHLTLRCTPQQSKSAMQLHNASADTAVERLTHQNALLWDVVEGKKGIKRSTAPLRPVILPAPPTPPTPPKSPPTNTKPRALSIFRGLDVVDSQFAQALRLPDKIDLHIYREFVAIVVDGVSVCRVPFIQVSALRMYGGVHAPQGLCYALLASFPVLLGRNRSRRNRVTIVERSE